VDEMGQIARTRKDNCDVEMLGWGSTDKDQGERRTCGEPCHVQWCLIGRNPMLTYDTKVHDSL
jgi:hypothetical protein